MGKITVKALEALRQKDVGRKLRDDGGMIGAVRPNGESISVQWSWRYRFDGKVRQVSLGTWPKTSILDIRDERDSMQAKVKQGQDPAESRKAEKLRERAKHQEDFNAAQTRLDEAEALNARMTVSELFRRWDLAVLGAYKDKGASVRQAFKKDVLPQLETLAIEDAKRSHIAGMIELIKARGVGRTAKRVLALVRQMFRWAVENEFIEIDPTATINKSKIAKDVERERALSEAEVRALYKALPEARMAKTSELAVLIQLATGCRIGEILQSRWEHIDIENATWRIPAEVAKNAREHTVSLSNFALAQFKALKAITGVSEGVPVTGGWVFPARLKQGHIDVKTITKQVGDRQRGERGAMQNRSPNVNALLLTGGRWTPHDLRRTAATIMVSLGVLPAVVERCLNHVEQNRMQRIYQRHDYNAEMADAWRLLGERLDLLTSDHNNVVTLQTRQA